MLIDKIKLELVEQRKSKFKGNIYHYSQVNFAYNSNKIEGGCLTADETEEIFETNSFIPESDVAINIDDLIEMRNHFRLFDYCLDIINEKLTKEIIIKMSMILKRNTTDEENPRYNVGGFKVVPNRIGLINIINTSAPENVDNDLDNLLKEYNNLEKITLEDIINFHYRFELIHPFGDGNGRVGRMIMFKECLRNNIMPFIVLDSDRPYYMRGLREYKKNKAFLMDTIKNEQDLYEEVAKDMLNFELEDK